MPIRKRLTNDVPVRNTTGILVLEMLLRAGNERHFSQKAIVLHIHRIWGLNAAPSRIADAELSHKDRALRIMTADSVVHSFDLSDMYCD